MDEDTTLKLVTNLDRAAIEKKLGDVRANEPCCDKLGVRPTRSRVCVTPASSSASPVMAVMEIGTDCSDSERRVAVTVISSSGPAADAGASWATTACKAAATPRAIPRVACRFAIGFMRDPFAIVICSSD